MYMYIVYTFLFKTKLSLFTYKWLLHFKYIFISIYLSQQSLKWLIKLMPEGKHFPRPQIGSQATTKTAKDEYKKYQIKIANLLSKLHDLDWFKLPTMK